MPRARLSPTPALQEQICAFIRAGGFPRVAAEAAGVPARTFARWLRRGRQRRAPAAYRTFADAIAQATAHARLKAELEVRENRPLDWLKSGPGKETRGNPGWTSAPRPTPARRGAAASPLEDPRFAEMMARLLELLAASPELRAQVAELVDVPRHPSRRRRR